MHVEETRESLTAVSEGATYQTFFIYFDTREEAEDAVRLLKKWGVKEPRGVALASERAGQDTQGMKGP